MWSDLSWGFMMMLVGMGVVFGLLVLLMLVLMAVGRLDRGAESPPTNAEVVEGAEVLADSGERRVRIHSVGLDADQIAAIAVAVMTHAEVRRRLAGPETRVHAPGSQLHTSRWLAVGRAAQNQPFVRK